MTRADAFTPEAVNASWRNALRALLTQARLADEAACTEEERRLARDAYRVFCHIRDKPTTEEDFDRAWFTRTGK